MPTVQTVDQKTHGADYVLRRETTRDKVYFTTYRKHGSEDIAFYSGNTMTGIVRNLEPSRLRELIEQAEGDSE